jgi:hypothetical protein
MTESDGRGNVAPDAGAPPITSEFEVDEATCPSTDGGPAPDEAFGALASEVRVTVLVRLLSAERAGEEPLAFSELQEAAGSDSSAGFAYHLRQLSGHFVRRVEDGYVLTPPGRRAAEAVVSGAFTDASETGRAS